MAATDEEREEILTLLDEGLFRLGRIETDIKSLVAQSQDPNPIAHAIQSALAQIDTDAQFETIRQSRARIRWVRAKIELNDYSDDDADEICAVLDEVKAMGQQLRVASRVYITSIQAQTENN